METPGQAPLQPMTPSEALGVLAEAIEKSDSGEVPRDEMGRFIKVETPAETPTEVAQPGTEATQEGEEAPALEETQVEIKPETRRFKLKYKGEEMEKDEPELIELAQKGFDYTQKSQTLAKERDEVQLKIKGEVEANRKQYETQLETYKQAVLKLADPEIFNVDLAKLAIDDPGKAQQLYFKQQQVSNTLQAIHLEQQNIALTRQTEMQNDLRKQAEKAVETLEIEIPEWSNDLYGKILKTGVDYGFTKEEMNAMTDPRAVKALNDARKWREYQAAKPTAVDKRVAAVPKVTKPGAGEKPDSSAGKHKIGMDKLIQSGRREDAVSLVAEMLRTGKL